MSRMEGDDDGFRHSQALRLVKRILIGARELERKFDQCLSRHGLNLTRAEVLSCLAAQDDAGCSQTELATSLRLSESNICTLVERMRSDGWLFRLRSDVDRRRSVIVLTPQGADILKKLDRLRQDQAAEWFHEWTPDELFRLNLLLDRVLQALGGDSQASVRAAGQTELRRAS